MSDHSDTRKQEAPPEKEAPSSRSVPHSTHSAQEAGTMLEAALAYLRRGFVPSPCGADKRPLLGWKRFQTERPTEAEVRSWWTQWPKANIALITGWGLNDREGTLAVVDIDDPALAEKVLAELRDTTTLVKSPGGGLHVYFLESSPSKSGPTVPETMDLKAVGGYVLAPPSRASEKGYQFVSATGIQAVTSAHAQGVAILSRHGIPVPDRSVVVNLQDGQPVTEGARNETLTSVAGSLRRRRADAETIEAALLAVNAKRCQPPLDDSEVRLIAQSIGKYAPKTSFTEGRADHSEPVLTRLSDVEREEVRWLWTNRIALGKLCVIQGDPEMGKSWLSLALSAAVTLGNPLPGDDAKREPANVLLLTAEDDLADTVRPRLEDMGADLTRVQAFSAVRDAQGNERQPSLVDDLAQMEAILASGGYSLLVIDPISAYLGARLDTYRDAAVRSVLAPLARLAGRYGVAVVCILHLTKSQRDRAIYRGQASIAFAGAARTVHLVGVDPGNECERVIACLKNNLASHPPALTFTITDGQFLWGKETTVTPQALLQPDASEDERDELNEAKEFLSEQLSGEPVKVDEVKKKARSENLSERTLRRAKKVLGVVSVREGYGSDGWWTWSLPKGAKNTPSGVATYGSSTNLRGEPLIHGQPTLQRSLATYGSGTPERIPPCSKTTKAPCEHTNWRSDSTMDSRFVCGDCRAVWDWPS